MVGRASPIVSMHAYIPRICFAPKLAISLALLCRLSLARYPTNNNNETIGFLIRYSKSERGGKEAEADVVPLFPRKRILFIHIP
jgi:hypothetical protein